MSVDYEDLVDATYEARSEGRDPVHLELTSATMEDLLDDDNFVSDSKTEEASDGTAVASLSIYESERDALVTEDGSVFDL